MKHLRIGLLFLIVSIAYYPAIAQYEIITEKFSPNKEYGEDISHSDRSAFYSLDYFNAKQKIIYTPEYTIASGYSARCNLFSYKISFQKVDEQYYLYIDFLSKEPNLNISGVDNTIFEFRNGKKITIPVTMSASRLDIKSTNKRNAWTSYSIRSTITHDQLETFTNTQLLSISQRFKSIGVLKASVLDKSSYYLAMSATYFLSNIKTNRSAIVDRFIASSCYKYTDNKWDY